MKTSTSKLTKKYQATVPEIIRKKLHLNTGDFVAFDIDGDIIRLRKAKPVDIEFNSALTPILSEWMSNNDEEVYKDL